MRSTARLLVVVIAASACAAPAAGDAPIEQNPTTVHRLRPSGEIIQLSPSVFVAMTEPWSSNSLIVEVDDGTLVLVDTPSTPAATAALLDWMEATFGARRVVAVNSHYHVDCLGGNEVLAARGIEILASDETAALLAANGPAMMDRVVAAFASDPTLQRELQRIQLTPPTTLFPLAEGKTLRFGRDTVRILFTGPGHTSDNVVVHFPEHEVVFGGCLIKAGRELGNVAEADLVRWPEAARVVERLGARFVVPGHGKRFSPEIVATTIEITRAAAPR